jgi:general stress protein 26
MAAHHDSPQEIAAKFIGKVKASPFIMLGLTDGQHSEVMNVKIDDDQPNALFVFAGKTNRAAKGGDATVQFVSKGHDFFASLIGQVTQDMDRATIDKLWDNNVEAWIEGGKDGGNYVLLRFDVESAELWETDVSLTGRVKQLFGGQIKPEESSSHAMVDSIA